MANLNTIGVTQCSAGSLNVTVDANNHINSSTAYVYDAAGNLTQDGTGNTYAFDAEGRLTLATGPTGGPYCYVYDGSSFRVAKKSSATTCSSGAVSKIYWRSLSGDTIAETDASGSTTNSAYNEYVFFAGRRVASRNGAGAIFYYFADHLGTVRTITTGNGPAQTPGQLCYDADFTPYGQEITHTERLQTTACPPNYKFTGYERDSETGLDYAFARYYSSRLGRFLSTDPLGGSIGDLQSHNAYAYVTNDPLNSTDSSGLVTDQDREPQWGGGFLFGGGRSCQLDGVETPCNFVGGLLGTGALQACLNAACTVKADLVPTLGGAQINLTGGYAVPAYPCPNGECRVSPPWVEIYVTVPIGWFAIPSAAGGNTSGNSTLDDRANALAKALNKTGVQSLGNPCTVAAFYGASALGGTGVAAGMNAGEVGATVKGVATTYWSNALNAGYNWLYRQSLRGDAIANFLLNIPKNYNKAKAAVLGGCNAMQ